MSDMNDDICFACGNQMRHMDKQIHIPEAVIHNKVPPNAKIERNSSRGVIGLIFSSC
jgi:hypothetical protein